MTFTFNLIRERWIPCIRADGEHEEFGLREALANAHRLREIRGDTPLETAALHRLLLSVLHRVFGPKNTSDWHKLWQKRERGLDMTALDSYLQQWEAKFDLFDDKQRFMQARDPRVSEKSIISLVIQMASGANGTLFDHHLESQEVQLSPAQAARALLVSQAFGIGGLSGLPDKFTDAPCAKGILFFALGDSLAETLILNLMAYGGENPIPNEEDDCPTWERSDLFRPERATPRGYLDYLTWPNREIWLFPKQVGDRVVVTQMCWAPGLRLVDNDLNPHKQYTRHDETEDWRILGFRSDRALWRDSAVLLRTGDNNRPPKVVKWLHDLADTGRLDVTRPYRLMALGMAKDRASLEFLRAENMPLLPTYLSVPAHMDALGTTLSKAEEVAVQVRWSVRLLARWFLKPATPEDKLTKDDRESFQEWADSICAEERYWSALEPHFHRLITDLPDDPGKATEAWHDELRRAAKTAFDYAEQCVSGDSRAYRAIVVASVQFYGGLHRLFLERAIAQQVDS